MNTSTPRMNRVLLTGAALVVAALAAGCASGSASSGSSAPAATTSVPATSAPATSAPAATTAPAATGSATGSATSNPNAAGAPACASADLRASVGQPNGAAGSSYLPIVFTNLGSSPCTLYGYPGVSQAGGSPVAQIGAAADRDPTSHATLVTLQAGRTANATLRIVDALNFPSSSCNAVSSTDLQIYPPDQTTPLFVSYKSTACSDSTTHLLTIGVVQLGSGSPS